MIELLTTIVIIAVIAVIATVFVGDYISRARLTAARHTVAVLNESLNEYRTLGGLTSGYSLTGSTGSTLNAATLTSTALEAMKTGFTNFGRKQTFVKQQDALNTTYIGSTGSGKSFHFVVDESATGTEKTITKVTPTLVMSDVTITYGTSLATVTVTTSTDALVGKSVVLTLTDTSNNSSVSSAQVMGTSKSLTYVMDAEGLPLGNHLLVAKTSAFSEGNTDYEATSASATLTVSAVSVTPTLTLSIPSQTYGSSVTITATASSADFSGQTATLTLDGSASGTATFNASGVASFTTSTSLSVGTHTIAVATAAFTNTSGTSSFAAVSASGSLTVSYGAGVGYMAKASAGTFNIGAYATSGYIAFQNAGGSISIKANSLTPLAGGGYSISGGVTLSSSTSYTFWACENSTSSVRSGDITYLVLGNAQLTNLDVSSCTALQYLQCSLNSLASLDVSKNFDLTNLYCYSNSLTSLDVSHNTKLKYFNCYSNQLTSLDVSANTALTGLYCQSNSLTSLDVSANTALTYLGVDSDVAPTGVPSGCTVTTY